MADTTRREEPSEPDTPEPDDASSAPTIREHGPYPAAGTLRQQGPPAAAPTMREAAATEPVAAGAGSSLPDELSSSYHLVRQLASGGGEATLFEVAEIRTGEIRVLKIYYRHVALRGEALLRIQSIDPAHVVHLVDYGQLEDGRWYEVQERIEAGNLVDYRSSASPTESGLEEVVAELAAAIAAFHRAGLAHHDIKPENILVRNTSPLDLVLGDFGLSVVSDNSTYYATNRHATIAYQAPETMRQVGGGTRDYWAIGLTIAMFATGETPYAGLNEHAILDQHYNQIPPAVVESMPEGRFKQLCRGLTRYDPKTRWSEQEVQSWLRGRTPAVAPDEPQPPVDSTRVVHFNNKRFTIPAALIREILECWSLAAETIGVTARREQFMDELILAFGTEPLARLTRRWSAEPPRRDRVDAAIVELLLTLDPEAPAIYRSRPLDADNIAAVALGDSEEDARFVRDLGDRGLLAAWSHGADYTELGDIDRRWQGELSRATEIISQVEAAGADAPPIGVWTAPLLAVSARDELLDEWQQQRAPRPFGDLMPGWYEQIADGSRPAEVIGSVLLFSEAQRIQRNASEARRQQRQEAERSRRDRKYRALLSLAGWTAAGAFLVSWVLGPGAGLIVYAIAFALFRQWRNAVADRRRVQESRGETPATEAHEVALTLFRRWRRARSDRRRAQQSRRGIVSAAASAVARQSRNARDRRRARSSRGEVPATAASPGRDELSASRRAEAYGILAFVLVVAWAITTDIWPPLVRLIASDSLDLVTVRHDGYKLAGLASIAWSLLSFRRRRNEGPPTADQIQQLQAADRRTMRRTLVVTGVWGFIRFASLSFSWSRSAVATLMLSVWVPISFGGMSLLVRGRWPHRPAGFRRAVVLLAASATLFAAGLLLEVLAT